MTYASFAYTPAQEVQYFDLWIGHWDAVSSLAVPAKQLQSNFKAFLYCNPLSRFSSGSNDPPGTFATFQNNGWLLKDTSNNLVSGGGSSYYVDFGNPAVWAWYANWINGYLTTYGLDGVQIDNVFWDSQVWYYTSQTAINPRTGVAWTDSQILNAYAGFISEIKDVLGPSKTVLINGIYNGESWRFPTTSIQALINAGADGVISEGWLGDAYSLSWAGFTEQNWVNSINMAVWLQNNLLAVKSNAVFLPLCACASTNPDVPGTLNGQATSAQYTTYAYASLLMAATYNGNYLFLGTTDSYSQSLFQINIGTPAGNYGMVSGTHVYSRNFTNGMVLVNPTATSYQVNVGSGFINAVTGASTSSTVTVPAYSGLILKG